ncbi:hypothetical protein K440DRAFT_676438 [Wilcoxina mikolae CBS 423.85]|nr:hypothetical protein K440DRAFT_676438 [Wilcoxina mikolae CBS 423.85]
MAPPHLHGLLLAQTTLQIIGNLSSAFGAIFIAACYIWILPLKTHFRHRLILNLAIADAINGFTGSFSQFYKIATNGRGLQPGAACKADGVIVQLSIQAVDISILAIAITTALAVIKPRLFEDWSSRKSTLITLATWGFPVTTSLIVLGLNKYEPASGGWCWISPKPVYLRYVMTHGWRYLIILVIVVLYTYLYFFLRKNYKNLATATGGSTFRRPGIFKRKEPETFHPEYEGDEVKLSVSATPSSPGFAASPITSPISPVKGMHVGMLSRDTSRAHADRYAKIKKVLLMKAYPTWFVILWIPGLVNRMIEATGHRSRVTALLQTSTAFIGLANAVTYGWNEGLLREYRRKREQRRRDRDFGPLDGSRFA